MCTKNGLKKMASYRPHPVIYEVNADFIPAFTDVESNVLGQRSERQTFLFSIHCAVFISSYLPNGNQTVRAWTFSNTIATWQHLQQVRIPVSLALSKVNRYFFES